MAAMAAMAALPQAALPQDQDPEWYMFDYEPYRDGQNPNHTPGSYSQTLAYIKGNLYDQTRREKFIQSVIRWLALHCVGPNIVIAIAPGHEATSYLGGFMHEIVGRLVAQVQSATISSGGIPTIVDGRKQLIRTKTVPKQSQTPGMRNEFTHRGTIAINPLITAASPPFAAAGLNQGKTVIILDDVWTSGSTLRVCKEVMLTTNPNEVKLFAIGKTVPVHLSFFP